MIGHKVREPFPGEAFVADGIKGLEYLRRKRGDEKGLGRLIQTNNVSVNLRAIYEEIL